MKKLIFLLGIVLLFAFSNVQAQKGQTIAQAVDTLNGAETVAFAAIEMKGGYNLTIQALCTELGGASDGTLWLEASVDGTSYQRIVWKESGDFEFFASDTTAYDRQGSTATIADALSVSVRIRNTDFLYYRLRATGDTGDTTLITPKYIFKKIE